MSSDNRTPDLFILGDFNFPELDWISPHRPSSSSTTEFLEFMDKNLLAQVVDKPTRGDNTLDLILTNAPRYLLEVDVRPTILSDHSVVSGLLGYNMLKKHYLPSSPNFDHQSFRSIDYHNADFQAMNTAFNVVDWQDLWVVCDMDPTTYLELMKLTILQVALIYSPVKEEPSTIHSGQKRNRFVAKMKRKQRKLKARKHAIQEKVLTPSQSQNCQRKSIFLRMKSRQRYFKASTKGKLKQFQPSNRTRNTSFLTQRGFRRLNQPFQYSETHLEI